MNIKHTLDTFKHEAEARVDDNMGIQVEFRHNETEIDTINLNKYNEETLAGLVDAEPFPPNTKLIAVRHDNSAHVRLVSYKQHSDDFTVHHIVTLTVEQTHDHDNETQLVATTNEQYQEAKRQDPVFSEDNE